VTRPFTAQRGFSLPFTRSLRLDGRLPLLVGAGLAVLTAVLIYFGLEFERQRVADSLQPQPAIVSPVVVAKTDIPAGTSLNSTSLHSQFSISRAAVTDLPDDAIATLETLDGRTTAVQLRAGEPVRTSQLVPPSDSTAGGARADLLPPGYVAIVLPVNDQISVGGAVVPTDRVDLIASLPVGDSTTGGPLVTQAVLRDIGVLATGFRTRPAASPTPAAANAEPQAPSPYSTLTLALTPQDAVAVQHLLANNVRLALALRRPTDAVEDTTPVTTSDLVRRFALKP
jgi:Flp pilus assembly protein CpaB